MVLPGSKIAVPPCFRWKQLHPRGANAVRGRRRQGVWPRRADRRPGAVSLEYHPSARSLNAPRGNMLTAIACLVLVQPTPPVPEARVRGRVILPRGAPAEPARRVVVTGAGSAAPSTVVGADGRFELAFEAAPGAELALELESRFLWLEEPFALDPEAGAEVVLEPSLGARVAGAVALEPGLAGDPSGAGVTLHGWTEDGGYLTRSTAVGPDGAFAFDALPAHAEYDVVAELASFLPAESVTLAPLPGEEVAVALVLRRLPVVSGRVVGPDGAPVGGARVFQMGPEAHAEAGPSDFERMELGTTADDGTFAFEGFETLQGCLHLSAWSVAGPREALHGTWFAEGVEGRSVRGVEIALARVATFEGRVLLPDGSPAAGAEIELVGPAESGAASLGHRARITSDEAGRFEVPLLEHELDLPLRVVARLAGDRGVLRGRAQVIAGTDLELSLAPARVVAGAVTDDLGAPVAAGTVVLLRGLGEDRQGLEYEVLDGRFELHPENDFGGDHGPWELYAYAADHLYSRSLLFDDLEAAPEPVALVCPRSPSVTVRVLRPDGSRAAGVPVLLARAETFVETTSDGLERTDGQGELELRPVVPGPLRASAWRGEIQLAERSFYAEPGEEVVVVLELPERGVLEGRATRANGRPLSDASVWAQQVSGGAAMDAVTNRDGGFRIANLPPGDWEVLLFESEEDESADAVARVALPPGGTARVELVVARRKPVAVTGRAAVGGGPLAFALVYLEDENGEVVAEGETGARGELELVLPGPGAYVFSLEHDEVRLEALVEVSGEGGERIDLDLPGGALEGRVVDASGEPVVGIEVYAEPELEGGPGPSSFTSSWTAPDGSFAVDIPAGTYRIGAGGHWEASGNPDLSFGSTLLSGVRVEAGSTVGGLELVLQPAVDVSGVVRDAHGDVAPGAIVFARDGAGNLLWRGGIAEADGLGRFNAAGLVPGRDELFAQTSYGLSRAVLVSAGTAELELVLEPASLVHVVRAGSLDVNAEAWSARDERGREVPLNMGESPMFGFHGAVVGPLHPGRCRVRCASADGELEVELDVDRVPETRAVLGGAR